MPDFDKLKKRTLVQWGVAYLAGAWLLLQVATVLGDQFDWSAFLLRLITVFLAAGFLVTLVIAWYHGEKGRQRAGGVELLMLASILALAAAAMTLVKNHSQAPADTSVKAADSLIDEDKLQWDDSLQGFTIQRSRGISVADLLPAGDYFPLRTGDQWIYEGTASSQYDYRDGKPLTKRISIRLTSRVIREIHKRHASMYIISGHPYDAVVWVQDIEISATELVEIEPSMHAYVVIGNKIFLIDEELIHIAIDNIENGYSLGDSVINESNYFMEIPLFVGQKYGDFSSLGRRDNYYTWSVESQNDYSINVADRLELLPSYEIRYNTLPATQIIHFSPRLGITRYEYSHHGTIQETSIALVGFGVHTFGLGSTQ